MLVSTALFLFSWRSASVQNCTDTADGATGSNGDDCAAIALHYDRRLPAWWNCDQHDDDDFSAGAVCCACGGGSTPAAAAAPAPAPSAPTLERQGSMRNTTSSASSGQRAPARADPSPSASPTFYTISTASVCVFGDRKYTGAAAVGTKVYFVPDTADNVGVLDTDSGSFSTISIKNASQRSVTAGMRDTQHYRYMGAAVLGSTVYFAPFDDSTIGVLDTERSSFSTISTALQCSWTAGFSLCDVGTGFAKWSGAAVVGTSVYFAPYLADSVGVLDTIISNFTVFSILAVGVSGYRKYFGAQAIGTKVYFGPHDAETVGVFDTEASLFSTIDMSPLQRGSGVSGLPEQLYFRGVVAVGNKLYLAPYTDDYFGVYDAESGNLSTISIPARDNNFYYSYMGGVAIGSTIYLAPHLEDNVGVLDTVSSTFSRIPLDTALTLDDVVPKFYGAAAVGGTAYFAPYSADAVGVVCTSNASACPLGTAASEAEHAMATQLQAEAAAQAETVVAENASGHLLAAGHAAHRSAAFAPAASGLHSALDDPTSHCGLSRPRSPPNAPPVEPPRHGLYGLVGAAPPGPWSVSNCTNTAHGSTDINGDGCDAYAFLWTGAEPLVMGWYCTAHDDDDFSAGTMCCACGGGSTPESAAAPAPAPSAPTLERLAPACASTLPEDEPYEMCVPLFCRKRTKADDCQYCKCRACDFCTDVPPPPPPPPPPTIVAATARQGTIGAPPPPLPTLVGPAPPPAPSSRVLSSWWAPAAGALFFLLFAGVMLCRHRRLARINANLCRSRDRAQLDLQLLAHQVSVQVGDGSEVPPSSSPPVSLPPAPPSSSGGRGSRVGGSVAAGSDAGGSAVAGWELASVCQAPDEGEGEFEDAAETSSGSRGSSSLESWAWSDAPPQPVDDDLLTEMAAQQAIDELGEQELAQVLDVEMLDTLERAEGSHKMIDVLERASLNAAARLRAGGGQKRRVDDQEGARGPNTSEIAPPLVAERGKRGRGQTDAGSSTAEGSSGDAAYSLEDRPAQLLRAAAQHRALVAAYVCGHPASSDTSTAATSLPPESPSRPPSEHLASPCFSPARSDSPRGKRGRGQTDAGSSTAEGSSGDAAYLLEDRPAQLLRAAAQHRALVAAYVCGHPASSDTSTAATSLPPESPSRPPSEHLASPPPPPCSPLQGRRAPRFSPARSDSPRECVAMLSLSSSEDRAAAPEARASTSWHGRSPSAPPLCDAPARPLAAAPTPAADADLSSCVSSTATACSSNASVAASPSSTVGSPPPPVTPSELPPPVTPFELADAEAAQPSEPAAALKAAAARAEELATEVSASRSIELLMRAKAVHAAASTALGAERTTPAAAVAHECAASAARRLQQAQALRVAASQMLDAAAPGAEEVAIGAPATAPQVPTRPPEARLLNQRVRIVGLIANLDGRHGTAYMYKAGHYSVRLEKNALSGVTDVAMGHLSRIPAHSLELAPRVVVAHPVVALPGFSAQGVSAMAPQQSPASSAATLAPYQPRVVVAHPVVALPGFSAQGVSAMAPQQSPASSAATLAPYQQHAPQIPSREFPAGPTVPPQFHHLKIASAYPHPLLG